MVSILWSEQVAGLSVGVMNMSEPMRRETEVTADCFEFDHVTLLYGLARGLMPTAFLSGLL